MINRILKSSFIGVLFLSIALFPMNKAFASEEIPSIEEGETIDAKAKITGRGTHNFDTSAGSIVNEGEDGKISWIDPKSENGINVKNGTLKDYGEVLFKNDPAGYKEFIESPYKVFLTHKDLSSKYGTNITYTKDGIAKTPSMFYPPGASAKEKAFIDIMFKIVDKRHNGKWSSGKDGGSIMYITKAEMEACLNDPSCAASVPEELCKNGECKPKEDPKKPEKPEEKDEHDEIISCEIGSGLKYKKTSTRDEGFDNVSGPYAVMVNVVPVKPANFESLTTKQKADWIATHKPQTVGPFKTPFGEYLDSHRSELRALREYGKTGGKGSDSNYRQAWEAFISGAKAAVSQGVPKYSITLDESNLNGNNRGAVFTFTELTKHASVSTQHKQDLYDEYGCVDTPYTESRLVYSTDANGKEYPEWESYTVWRKTYKLISSDTIIDGQFTENDVVAIEGGSFVPSKSYQTVSVKCNNEDFNTLVNSTGSSIITNTRAAGSAKSPILNGSVAKFYNHLDVDFFYSGKSCNRIYGCSAEPVSTGDDRDNNRRNTGDLVNNSYGAQADGKNTSEFAFFRDNSDKDVRVDIWFPKKMEEGGIDYNNEAAVKTYIVMDKNGTPQGDFFNLKGKDGSVIISGKDLPTKWYNQLTGQINEYKLSASWASDTGKPHRMMSIYAFKPTASAEIPSVYDRDGGTTKNMKDVVDMLCTAKFNTTEVTEPIVIHKPNELTDETFSDFNEDVNSHFKINFVKSSSE